MAKQDQLAQVTEKFKKLAENISKEQLMMFLPFGVCVILISIIVVILLPLKGKVTDLRNKIKEKESVLAYFEKSGADLNKLDKEVNELGEKVSEYEKKLIREEQANILIETLKDITAESYLNFSSIKPLTPRKFSLGKQRDLYLELPIKVELKCGYYDLIDFVQKIERAGRLMKITDLRIQTTKEGIWEHNVVLSISSFARFAREKEAR